MPEKSGSFSFFPLTDLARASTHMVVPEVLSIPKNMKLLAIPLFELYDNTARYGPQLAALVTALSRYDFVYL